MAVLFVVPGTRPAKGFASWVLRYVGLPPSRAMPFICSAIGMMLTFCPTVRPLTLLPTYATSSPTLHGSSRFRPAIHKSVYGSVKSGLRYEKLSPFRVARPSELPTGCRKPPPGKGLSSVVTGTPIAGPLTTMSVV